MDRALFGYLARYEVEYQNGRIRDYPLFPSGRFKRGFAKLTDSPSPLTRTAALGMFCELEKVAGVPHVAGRGWYGVRRTATDLAEDIEKDERILNSISGHSDSATRRGIYQEAERPDVLRRAAHIREAARQISGTL